MFAIFVASSLSAPLIHAHEERSFVQYMRDFGVFFTGDEYALRLGIFLSHIRHIQEHNAGQSTFKLGLNHLSHLTPAEYRSLLGARQPSAFEATPSTGFKAPASFDWRDKGAVCPIKNQAHCGSCWAFSVIQAQESQWFIKKGELISLSESNMVDCCTACYGCNGGWPDRTYNYVITKQKGMFMTEADYPYVAEDKPCKFDSNKGVTKVTGIIRIKAQDENDLKEKIAQYGPASICIDAGQASFHSYKTGIYDEPKCSSTWLDHAVGCVGYGSENGVDFWIVRNSWDTTWGEQGYVRMIRNKSNRCGIATAAIIPTDE